MLIRAATWLLLVIATCVPSTGDVFATPAALRPGDSPAVSSATVVTTKPTTAQTPAPTQPPDTVNDFLPEDRGIGDCISALPKPGCGSESRGGWAQTAVFGSIVLGIAFIVWRIVLSARRAKRQRREASS